jgi:hypothetical protein
MSKEEQEESAELAKLKKSILNSYEMMTPEEAISRLPDNLNNGVRNHLIEKSKSEEPLMFSLILGEAMRNNFFELKPKQR